MFGRKQKSKRASKTKIQLEKINHKLVAKEGETKKILR